MDNTLKRYWLYHNYSKDFVTTVENMNKIGKMVQIIMLCIMVFCIYIILLKPLFNQNNVFLLDSKIFIDSVILDTIALFLHYYFFYIITPIVFGYDAIYLSFCIDLAVQVRILKHKLKDVFSNSCSHTVSDITVCVDHHLLLLS